MTFYQANRLSRMSLERALWNRKAQYFCPVLEEAIPAIAEAFREHGQFVCQYYPHSHVDHLLKGAHAICVHTPDFMSYEILWSSDG